MKQLKDYNDAKEQAECDRILSKALLQQGIDKLKAGIDINTESGINAACQQLITILYGERGYFRDITLLEVLDKGDKAQYSITIGVKPTPLMREFMVDDPIELTIYLTSSK